VSETNFDVAAFTYAHRGLWGGDIPENSLRAFEAAAREGVGCELDVRVTADGKLVVFHDPTLKRMCGQPGQIDQLEEAFEAMAGEPTLVELKTDGTKRGDDGNHAGIPALIGILNASSAPAAVMSFDETAVGWLADDVHDRPIGQLIEPDEPGDEGWAIMKAIRASQGQASYFAPHISSLDYITEQFGYLPRVTWTVRDLPQLATARAHGAAPIFEGFSAALAKSFANTI
jgi:glycerophosphoryl diester phosphodiesterase